MPWKSKNHCAFSTVRTLVLTVFYPPPAGGAIRQPDSTVTDRGITGADVAPILTTCPKHASPHQRTRRRTSAITTTSESVSSPKLKPLVPLEAPDSPLVCCAHVWFWVSGSICSWIGVWFLCISGSPNLLQSYGLTSLTAQIGSITAFHYMDQSG